MPPSLASAFVSILRKARFFEHLIQGHLGTYDMIWTTGSILGKASAPLVAPPSVKMFPVLDQVSFVF